MSDRSRHLDCLRRLNEKYPKERAKAELEDRANVLSLEDFAFALVNQLADEYQIYDDGSFARAIWPANTVEEMQLIINRLQIHLLEAMKQAAGL